METKRSRAFVLGGGGRWGAVQIGMLRALVERDINPDLVLGTSIGALNGAMFASDPSVGGVERIHDAWRQLQETGVFGASVVGRLRTLIRHRTSLHTTEELEAVIDRFLPARRFEDLSLEFQCNAACIEDTDEHWFETGDLPAAILASSAVPGLLPPVEVAGLHYYDGGLVNSVPVDRAIALGASEIYVLHVGRIEQPLRVPTRPHEPALVAFEISRRHRLIHTLTTLPPEVEVRVMPSGNSLDFDDPRQLRWTDLGATDELIRNARAASATYLDEARRA